ncbi:MULTISPECIES: hypothetical protein [unclassified Polaribacter]|uniref:hypothetical protein n=1 Tax=unclassified Polaribacter TaxID=196858 RepID=UPI0011BEC27A|nr:MULTISPECIES: hypothetical protein [unclassified Polaribacter]TXD48124.1 hypothetical protein ES043_18015 [Polaribacter sp. IC063]TXD56903.1 hypothetical protein ES044_16040 [Polaribacter sp. IC066]
MKNSFTILFLFVLSTLFAQNEKLFERLQAIDNDGLTFYEVDGINISSQTLNYKFTDKKLKKVYRKYSIKKKDKKTTDTNLKYKNYYVSKTDLITENLTQNSSYYFLENKNKRTTIIQFGSINKKDKEFERRMVKLIMENKIPKKCYNSLVIDSINFVNRKIKLGNNCQWQNVNNVQCPYNGQMSWSVHKELKDAENTVEQQFEITKSKKGGKVISEEIVEIEFEGAKTKAKKVIYDFTGITSVLANMSGGKTLTIYYVASEVRDNYVSCVLSFWNNDRITKDGLTRLLEEVMTLKK